MTMHKALHPKNDVDRLYVSRKEGGRGLASIEDSVDASIQRLEVYIGKKNEQDDKMTINRKQKWGKNNVRFKRQLNSISHPKTWTWLRKGNLKKETESLRIATRDNAIRTNHIKARIDKTQQNSKCTLCGDSD